MVSEMKKIFKKKKQDSIDKQYFEYTKEWIRIYISQEISTYFEKKLLENALEYNPQTKKEYEKIYISVKDCYLDFGNNPEKIYPFIVNILDYLHRCWVIDNHEKFFTRNKNYEHMISELIWWKRFKVYLKYLAPYLRHFKIRYNVNWIRKEYNKQIFRYFEKYSIKSEDSLVYRINLGKHFFPELAEFPEILECITDEEYVKKHIIPSIKKQGTDIARWMKKVEDEEKEFCIL